MAAPISLLEYLNDLPNVLAYTDDHSVTLYVQTDAVPPGTISFHDVQPQDYGQLNYQEHVVANIQDVAQWRETILWVRMSCLNYEQENSFFFLSLLPNLRHVIFERVQAQNHVIPPYRIPITSIFNHLPVKERIEELNFTRCDFLDMIPSTIEEFSRLFLLSISNHITDVSVPREIKRLPLRNLTIISEFTGVENIVTMAIHEIPETLILDRHSLLDAYDQRAIAPYKYLLTPFANIPQIVNASDFLRQLLQLEAPGFGRATNRGGGRSLLEYLNGLPNITAYIDDEDLYVQTSTVIPDDDLYGIQPEDFGHLNYVEDVAANIHQLERWRETILSVTMTCLNYQDQNSFFFLSLLPNLRHVIFVRVGAQTDAINTTSIFNQLPVKDQISVFRFQNCDFLDMIPVTIEEFSNLSFLIISDHITDVSVPREIKRLPLDYLSIDSEFTGVENIVTMAINEIPDDLILHRPTLEGVFDEDVIAPYTHLLTPFGNDPELVNASQFLRVVLLVQAEMGGTMKGGGGRRYHRGRRHWKRKSGSKKCKMSRKQYRHRRHQKKRITRRKKSIVFGLDSS